MKTAISIPDRLFEEAEQLAERLKKSRSQLYQDAIAEYLVRHDPESITQRMNEVCDALGSPRDEGWAAASEAALRRDEW